MTVAENKAKLLRWVDALNRRDMKMFDEIYAPTFFDHSLPPGAPNGREHLRQALAEVLAAFPDAHEVTEEIVGEGDLLVTRWRTEATHAREFMGIPPSGKKVTIRGIHMYRMVNGQLTDVWRGDYLAGLLEQLKG